MLFWTRVINIFLIFVKHYFSEKKSSLQSTVGSWQLRKEEFLSCFD